MSLDTVALRDALRSRISEVGGWERVITFEPKAAPGQGMTCVLFADSLSARPATGLKRSAALMVWLARVMLPMQTAPADDVDTRVMAQVDKLMNALIGHFTLGGLVRSVDVRGMAGTPLSAEFGYVEISSTVYRFAEVTVPLIVNDVWTEVP